MIDEQTVARIIDAAHIEDVVGDFVTLKRRGVNFIGLCPFHDEKTPSFIVSPAKGIFKCFGCGKAGNSVHFVMEHEQLSYVDALRFLARKYHIEIQEKELTPEERARQSDRESLFALNQWAATYFSDHLHNTPDGNAIGMSYFRERGFTDETIRKFGLGYCPDTYDHMSLDALQAGYRADFVEQSGLGIRRENGTWYDRFRGRVIFPVLTLSGKVVAFGGRVLKKSDKTAKYVNSPESIIYHKSNELYGLYFAKQSIVKADSCILVEGYTDVISMHQSGVTNVVASSGTSLTVGQIRLIHRFTPNVTVIYDGDAAGIKASIRGIDLLLEEGINVKVLLLPDGEDPDSFAQSHDAAFFIDFIDKNQVDFIQFKIKLLMADVGNDPIRRASLISDVTRSVALIPDNITRSVYIKETAVALEVDEYIIAAEVKKIIADKRQKELAQKSRGNFEPYHYSTDAAPQKHATSPAYRQSASPATTPSSPDDTQASSDIDTQAPAVTSPDVSSLPRAALRSDADVFDTFEQNIIRYLVRYGEVTLPVKLDAGRVNVAVFIDSALDEVEPKFHNPLYQRIFDLGRDGVFNHHTAAVFYRDFPDADISAVAANLLADGEILSRLWEKRFNPPTPKIKDGKIIEPSEKDIQAYRLQKHERFIEDLINGLSAVIHEYKLAILDHNENQIRQQISALEKQGKNHEAIKLLLPLNEIKLRQGIFSKRVGERVVSGPRKK